MVLEIYLLFVELQKTEFSRPGRFTEVRLKYFPMFHYNQAKTHVYKQTVNPPDKYIFSNSIVICIQSISVKLFPRKTNVFCMRFFIHVCSANSVSELRPKPSTKRVEVGRKSRRTASHAREALWGVNE